ncbi:MAG: hypothetical protein KDG52_19835 [Rhodocyclaceae bacterium]|nr:hypothetical protein [Rhodocyclaceae bacterium]
MRSIPLVLPSLLCALLLAPGRPAVAAEFAAAVAVNINQATAAPSLVALAEALLGRRQALAGANERGTDRKDGSGHAAPGPDLLAKLVMHHLATGH